MSRPRTRRSDAEMIVTSIRMELGLRERMREIAGKRKYQALIRKILWDWIEKKESEQDGR